MANYEIRISSDDFESDGVPEVLVEFWNLDKSVDTDYTLPGLKILVTQKGELSHTAYATTPELGKPYDTVKSGADVDGVAGVGQADNELVLGLVNAFAKLKISSQ